jgi:hypothetical protein
MPTIPAMAMSIPALAHPSKRYVTTVKTATHVVNKATNKRSSGRQ